jgi:hypothetical protein
MLKRLCLALAGIFVLASLAHAAGTVPGFSLTPQFDLTGKVAPGCKLYIYQAGTVATPQNAYQDSALTLLQPNPMICDAGGRIGQFFVADGTIKLRLTDKNGVQLFVGDNLVVVGASSGGGGGGTVDPTTILATGDIKVAYGTGVLTGFVRANGRTIGSSTSGATERANSDTQSLFQYLWGADANLAVSGGRGVSAAADWAANKTLTLPDWRGRALAGLDDMGSSAAGRLTASYFGTAATVLGAAGGAEKQTLAPTQIPTITSANLAQAITVTPAGGAGQVATSTSGWAGSTVLASSVTGIAFTSGSVGTTNSFSGNNSISVSSNNTGGGSPTPVITAQPTMLATIYVKL